MNQGTGKLNEGKGFLFTKNKTIRESLGENIENPTFNILQQENVTKTYEINLKKNNLFFFT